MNNRLFGADKRTLFRVFFFGAFLFVIYQVLCILSPFLTPLMVALTLTLIFYPMHAWVRRKVKNPNAAAGLSTSLILLMVIVPALFFTWTLVRQATYIYPWAQDKVHTLRTAEAGSLKEKLPVPLQSAWTRSEQFLEALDIDPQDIFLKNLGQVGNRISVFGSRLLRNAVFLVFDIMVMVFTLFFFFRDGQRLLLKIVDIIPMEPHHKEHILSRVDQTLSAVVRGLFITAAIQGLLAGLGYAAAGLNFSVFLGFATAFTALIPFVGAMAIWVPVNAYVFLNGDTTTAVVLLVWNILVVSLVDNFLKPYLIGEKAKLPIFLLFFGILGGLQVYGVIGILIGPLMIAGVLSFAKIYRDQMQHPGGEGAPPALPPS